MNPYQMIKSHPVRVYIDERDPRLLNVSDIKYRVNDFEVVVEIRGVNSGNLEILEIKRTDNDLILFERDRVSGVCRHVADVANCLHELYYYILSNFASFYDRYLLRMPDPEPADATCSHFREYYYDPVREVITNKI